MEYTDSVVEMLRTSPELATLIEPSSFCSEGRGDCLLQNGNIRGLSHFSHNKKPRLQVPNAKSSSVTTATTFDVTGTVLVKDVLFDALYEYASVSGNLQGRVEIVRIDLVIKGERRSVQRLKYAGFD